MDVAKNGTRMEANIAACKTCDDNIKYKYLIEAKSTNTSGDTEPTPVRLSDLGTENYATDNDVEAVASVVSNLKRSLNASALDNATPKKAKINQYFRSTSVDALELTPTIASCSQ